MIGRLRQAGVGMVDCVLVLHQAAGMSLGDAKRGVHVSPVWAEDREPDEQTEETFWRALFIDCVLNDGRVDEPPQWAAECRERQQRATGQLRALAAELPVETPVGRRLGAAFAAVVDAGQRHAMPRRFWLGLAQVAQTLCLDEIEDADSDEARRACGP